MSIPLTENHGAHQLSIIVSGQAGEGQVGTDPRPAHRLPQCGDLDRSGESVHREMLTSHHGGLLSLTG
jgi:hypothetical protein